MPKIAVNDIEIYYELHGPPEAEVVALSNGVLMSTASWVFQTAALSQRYRLLLYDCRGMWQSEHPPGPYSMDMHADDLAGLLDALGIAAAHIGGTSYGAEVSMVFALKYPERTKSLMVTTAVSHVEPLLQGLIDTWNGAALAHDAERLFQVVYPLTFSSPWITANQETLDQARERYQSLDFDAFSALLLSFSQLDITADLYKISAPTLVVAAEKDIIKPRHYSEIIANEIPNAEFAVIPDAGHAALWEKADVFNTLLLGFLAKQDIQSQD
ncbi:MAG: alpha/beta fold hydrolase [Ardenticatenaceae bacterium]|nr:alpha/beta fold hydrolase [Anaerolineales bacterium]MCB8923795.1 alpha/beta fold hydrolase [Ardenticatenaceae bacterium]MCB8990130.1 alpha/beta fold hydrolase [Ardenticatenaceae bacterium]